MLDKLSDVRPIETMPSPSDVPGSFRALIDALAHDPGLRGRQFEEICGWFLTNSPVYRARIKTVWRWDEWPGRWGPDAGIDLVAEEHDGSLWAIQAKAYAPEYAITKADVDSFLSESARPQFSFRLLMATTNRLGTTARRTIAEQEKPASLLMLGDLELTEVDWPSSPDDLRPARPLPRQPRLHQEEAISAVLDGFNRHDRGQLLMACGTGKTLTALWISETLESRRTLILVPSLSLLSQTLQSWLSNATDHPEYIVVCSDESVTSATDAFLEHVSDIGVPVTTDPQAIAAFLHSVGKQFVFATYQSSPRIVEALQQGCPPFDLVIADEAHRCSGPARGAFATVLDAQAIPATRRLFMTATPRTFTDHVRRKAQESDFEVASMDDLDRFGPVFHHLSFAEAIRRDLLADYQVVVIAVTDDTYRVYADRGQFVTIDGVVVADARRLASQIALAKAMRDYNLTRVISFHSRVNGASEFAQSFPHVVAWLPDDERPSGLVWARKISGDMSSGERDVLLGHFRSPGDGQRRLLTNARCLAEGVDVPSIDGVAFIDPRRSQIDVVQAVGRAIRQSPSKTVGTIIIPVFIGPDEDPASMLESSVFEPVWAVLKALRAHDEVLAEELDELRRGLGRRAAARIRLPGKLHLDLPESVGEAFARAFETRIVEETTSSWEASFGVLERLVERTGSAEIPRDLMDEGVAIGRWVSKQRSRFRDDDLSPERVHRLEALRGWVWNPHEEAWDEGFSHLVRFTERHGHALVPTKHREDGYQLGQWINSIRNRYQRGELSPQRIAALEALPKWTWDGRQSLWDEGFNTLCAYEQEHGHTRVPHDFQFDEMPLGNWVANQRRFQATGKLSAERVARLESLKGWSWNTLEDDWALGLERLKQFRAREGHALVPQTYIEEGVLLGRWVLIQRQRRSKMTPERVRLLEEVDGWAWEALETVWFQNYALLCDYVGREQHSLVPHDAVIDGVKLGIWVWKQRQDGRLGKLRADRRELLEQTPNWEWESNKDLALWERRFQQLQRSPHLFTSTSSKTLKEREDRLLREWVAKQRQAYHDGTLGSSRAARLAALPGWRWDPDDEEWSHGLTALRSFAEREGHTIPPRSTMVADFPLGVWIATQRHRFTRGKLPPQYQLDLEEVPGWRWSKATSRSTPDISSPKPDSWEQGCRALVAFHAEHGHAQVPASHIEAKFRLGAWVSRQRMTYRDGKLAAEKVHFLESLAGWSWHPKPDAWDHGFAVLRLFVQREAHAIVPRDHVEEGFKLGAWVVEQRTAYNQGRIKSARAQQLESLPRWCWSRRDAWWEEGFTHLQSFYQREKHTRVPRNHVERGFDLSRWVNNQRGRTRNHPERAERLMQFPDWYWY